LKTVPNTIEGIHYSTGQPVRLTIANGLIGSIEHMGTESGRTTGQEPDRTTARNLPVIAPGLVDLQVNGIMGIDFNDPDLNAERVEAASSHLLHHGVTAYCPTLITGPAERTTRLIGVIAEAAGRGGLAGAMITGIHIEGPFISREPGPRGAHPQRYCTDPDPELFKRWQDRAEGRIRILTLAPELPGSEAMIRLCIQMGAIAAIGHTAAGSEEIKRAADAGATLSTHLGNGAHAVLPRHPNYIWDQLAEERLCASFIADGFHLPDAVLRVFMAVKREKAILVSDSMEYSGMPPGVYQSPATGRIRLTPEGKLHREGDPGTLAGSASLLLDGVRRITRLRGLSHAWNMASLHPSNLLFENSGNGPVRAAGHSEDHGTADRSRPGASAAADGLRDDALAAADGLRTGASDAADGLRPGALAAADGLRPGAPAAADGLQAGNPADLVLLNHAEGEIRLLKILKNGVGHVP
jgi:N-acetylglucosamine-6-phosphate deacetylase